MKSTAPDAASELFGMLLVMASACLYAVVACMIKFTALPTLIMLQVQAVVESVLGVLACGVVQEKRDLRFSPWLFVRAFVYFLFLVCWFQTLALLPVGDAVTLVSTAPVFTALFAWLLLGERVDGAFFPVLLLNFTGLVLITRPSFVFGGAHPAHGDAHAYAHGTRMALLAAGIGGALPVCTRKLPDVSWTVVNSVGSLLMAGVFAPAGLAFFPQRTAAWETDLRGHAAWLGAACTLGFIALGMQTLGYQRAPAARASVMTACQIPVSYLLQWAFFADPASALGLAGSVMIVGGSAINAFRAQPKTQRVQ